ncbi:MAG TPA: LLM class F420-dependent oxidoreductase [Solirubrobacteraceae bacterium]|nr:LLM class F420-dependent oxidoreductase [Solirubrobacteraceae bacterium]
MAGDPSPQTRWGLTLPFPGVSLADSEALIRQAEDQGYDDLWTGDTTGPDGFTPLALAAAWTERVRLGTGIVSTFTRGPAVLAQQAAALADASRGRFVLGLGASSNVIVERWNQIPFDKPLSKVRDTVAALRPILAGERGPGGFKLEQAPASPVPIYVAALREKMLALAGEIGDGAFVNFLPLSGLPTVTEHIREGEARAGKAPGSVDVVCRFFCVPQSAEEGMGLARFMFAAYGTVPVYAEFFRWLGWGEQLDPMVAAWREGDRARALELAPEELIREIFIFGSPEEQRERLEQYAAGGIRTLVLTPITAPEDLARMIGSLAR